MKVLLLGATGTLGSRVAPALLAHKHEVVAFVRSESKLKEILPPSILSAITVVRGDASNSATVSDALANHKCDALINTAGQANIFPWQAPRMQEIINAVATAGVEASQKLGRPIRGWFLGGMTALDIPGLEGTMLLKYFPMFPEHALTYACLSSKPQENLAWSLLCPSVMSPVSREITLPEGSRNNPLIASADIPPGWKQPWFDSVPFLGLLFAIFSNAPRYNIKLEDCADFMAADLENSNTEFIGHRVGLQDSGKGKSD